MKLEIQQTPIGHRIEVAGMRDWLDLADQPATVPEQRRQSRTSKSRDFSGVGSYEEATSLARKGWPEGRDRIAEMSGVFINRVVSKMWQPETRLMEEGDAIDVATLMSGEPEAFINIVDSDVTADNPSATPKVVKIAVNLTVPWWVTTDIIERRGCAVAALVAALEQTGRSCEIVGIFAFAGNDYAHDSNKGKQLQIAITVKRPDQPLQFDVLAFVLCHGSSLRRIGLGIMETIPADVRQHYAMMGNAEGMGSYGQVATLEKVEADIILDNADLHNCAWKDDAEAVKWTLQQLQEQGIELLD